MHSNLQIAYGFIGVLAGIILLGLIVLYSLKLRDVRRRRAEERCSAKHGDWLDYVFAHLDGEDPLYPPPEPLQGAENRLVLDRLIAWIEQFRGEPREKLIALCERMGFAERELKRLDSPLQWVKLDAAYRLGCLRAHEAVPRMLELLGRMRSGPLVFIVARAIAKCARDSGELREMAHLLLAHKKEAEPLIADILLESPLDYTAMLQTFLRSGDPERIRLALAAMRKVGPAGSGDRLFELTRSEHAAIRRQAAKLLLRDCASLAEARIRRLLGHADPEIRAEAVQAAGGLRRREYAGLLRASMNDPDWQVRMNSAFALAKLGEEGLAVLRDAADRGAEAQAEAARAALRESGRRREAGSLRRGADWVPVRSV
ncbi:HEAT repeat domain-containing protein [Cohnella zeiphila]|uniref:HEAT repeat domain-containing protein n=1 Tax=Cohnella zeiphila TaxID=2761120 RepID=A0A7X0SHA6_9BACL|nr:HEAT repeat domain-containing protein [Cohnella zeiphila]MBB6729961.1 HEAT repeat domain-containing protein [Cohnella zeiphila]